MKYGTPNDNGEIIIPVEKVGEANKEMMELMETENDVKLYGIELKDFGDNLIDFSLIEGIASIIKEE